MGDATVVLVHGAFCGDWIFKNLTAALQDRGIDVVTTNLPSCSATDTSINLHDDVAYVREVVEKVDGPIVLVGSSYGGAVISGVDHPNVKRLVFVAAAIPDAGEAAMLGLAKASTKEFSAGVSYGSDGLARMDPEGGVRTAFQQASAADQDDWRRYGSAMSFGTDFEISNPIASWRTIPSTYVVCGEDRSIDPAAQRRWAAERATEMVEFPFDHCPGVSHAPEIADLLAQLAAAVPA
jgi:pimeloyl-ACP methyl ester carboxylesterase